MCKTHYSFVQPAVLCWLLAFAWFGVAGCGGRSAATPSPAPAQPHPVAAPASARTAPTAADLARMKPNEVGMIPVLEYHDISPRESRWGRSVAAFKSDLDRLYREGYRPVLVSELAANRIDVPAGRSPVVLTFDDARESQFRYLPDGRIDPSCAVGVLQAFHTEHPDFPVKADFYVLPLSGFGPASQAAKKMQALLAMGCELGNHTVTHTPLKRLTDEGVQKEIGGCVKLIARMAPTAKVDSIALPDGIAPKNRALLASGAYEGVHYENRAALLVGANPAPSPVSVDFKPLKIPRIQAIEGIDGITFWLDYLKRHPGKRYVSDGDPATVTVPGRLKEKIDTAKLQGATVRTY